MIITPIFLLLSDFAFSLISTRGSSSPTKAGLDPCPRINAICTSVDPPIKSIGSHAACQMQNTQIAHLRINRHNGLARDMAVMIAKRMMEFRNSMGMVQRWPSYG
jgi:hypothetical protein